MRDWSILVAEDGSGHCSALMRLAQCPAYKGGAATGANPNHHVLGSNLMLRNHLPTIGLIVFGSLVCLDQRT